MEFTLEDQLEFEKEQKKKLQELIVQKLEESLEKGRGANTQLGKGVIKNLTNDFYRNVRTFLEQELKPKRGVQKVYKRMLEEHIKELDFDYVCLLLCTATLNGVMNAVGQKRMTTVSYILMSIANNYIEDISLEAFIRKNPDNKRGLEHNLNIRVARNKKEIYLHRVYKLNNFTIYKASTKEILALLMNLLEILIKTTNMFEIGTNKSGNCLYATDYFYKVWSVNLQNILAHITGKTPTIIEPKPWTSLEEGGYYGELSTKLSFIRQIYFIQKTRTYKEYIRKIGELDLSYIMQAVNKVQSTPYKVNMQMLDIVRFYINNGGGVAGITPTEPEEEIKELQGDFTEEELKKHKRLYVDRIHREIKRKSKALRDFVTYNHALEFSKYPKIYFPCNIDFRGRIYPISRFNHQGDDLMKSLIVYAEPKACEDKADIQLLQIQGCNLYGNDKISLEDRVKWTTDNLHHILNSAENPLDYTWWQSADEPLQFLAFCLEYAKAHEYMQENNNSIVGYCCSIPISYDGTCSGLQHYSALLLDEVGGSAVNLIDNDKPSDIYQEVADKVIPLVEYDSINGTTDTELEDGYIKRGTQSLAIAWLSHGITRKVCKRPVMTLAYGSGKYGFKEQIYEDTCSDNPYFKGIEMQASIYMADLISKVIKEVVVAATNGMKYLKDIATELIKKDIPVNWWTPLGLPVQQQYLKSTRESFRTRLSGKMSMPIYYWEINPEEHIDKNHQKNGIAPNFIHSLDATHLMMVVNEGGLKNYTTIHDSFGTSLGEARHLKKVIREQLYKLYTEYEPLESFKEGIEDIIKTKIKTKAPKKGNLDLRQILKSKYVFH